MAEELEKQVETDLLGVTREYLSTVRLILVRAEVAGISRSRLADIRFRVIDELVQDVLGSELSNSPPKATH